MPPLYFSQSAATCAFIAAKSVVQGSGMHVSVMYIFSDHRPYPLSASLQSRQHDVVAIRGTEEARLALAGEVDCRATRVTVELLCCMEADARTVWNIPRWVIDRRGYTVRWQSTEPNTGILVSVVRLHTVTKVTVMRVFVVIRGASPNPRRRAVVVGCKRGLWLTLPPLRRTTLSSLGYTGIATRIGEPTHVPLPWLGAHAVAAHVTPAAASSPSCRVRGTQGCAWPRYRDGQRPRPLVASIDAAASSSLSLLQWRCPPSPHAPRDLDYRRGNRKIMTLGKLACPSPIDRRRTSAIPSRKPVLGRLFLGQEASGGSTSCQRHGAKSAAEPDDHSQVIAHHLVYTVDELSQEGTSMVAMSVTWTDYLVVFRREALVGLTQTNKTIRLFDTVWEGPNRSRDARRVYLLIGLSGKFIFVHWPPSGFAVCHCRVTGDVLTHCQLSFLTTTQGSQPASHYDTTALASLLTTSVIHDTSATTNMSSAYSTSPDATTTP
ncbi:hypothetical protein EDB86DRAFT_3245573 [Lactarius hatsudake]|nr:hypothetical protein EDB86DRAFT_3245573 [Lactarius hatsudake]